jgi:hydroxylamine reductase
VLFRSNIFTAGTVGWPEVSHVTGRDFSPIINRALALPGFAADTNGKSVMVGFARETVMSVAGKVIDAVKAGQIRHFFLVAGCDGAKPGRNYYTEFVEKLPKDTVVLTLACGKFRFFDKDLGDIGGIPRLLDVGQCNDAYSAIQVAVALSKAFNVGVNELPLSMILSWYEQKAVAILLTLLYLGIKNIRLGPSLPAFITPNILKVLVDNYGIKPITTPDEDIKSILG